MSLNNLKTRLNYYGGKQQVDRMIEDKERSFRDSLWRAYQSATAVLQDGREFRCLINPNKLSMELDDKMLSIPFKDICLNKAPGADGKTSVAKEDIGVKCGDVIAWKENNTHWIVYSQYLQEIAYFRGLMRQCENEPLTINGKDYYYYLKGPDEKGIDWQKTKHFVFNELNYNIEIYISNDQITNQFFQRFQKCNIKGKPYEVQAVDRLTTEGILTVYLKEDFGNNWEQVDIIEEPDDSLIIGPKEVYPFDIVSYSIQDQNDGTWSISNKRASIIEQNDSFVKIEIITGKSGDFSLIYKKDGIEDIIKNIKILSL